MKRIRKRKKGFTLLEVLITMFIVVMLTGAGIAGYMQTMDQARYTTVASDLKAFASSYYGLCMSSPGIANTTAEVDQDIDVVRALNETLDEQMRIDFSATGTNLDSYSSITSTTELKTIHKDPWGNAYRIYVHQANVDMGDGVKANNTELRIFVVSFGKNGTSEHSSDVTKCDTSDDIIYCTQIVNSVISEGQFDYSKKEGALKFGTEGDLSTAYVKPYAAPAD